MLTKKEKFECTAFFGLVFICAGLVLMLAISFIINLELFCLVLAGEFIFCGYWLVRYGVENL